MVKDDIYIYPTDTVWGIGCSLYSEKGQERLAEIKGTQKNKPLSIMFESAQHVLESFSFSDKINLYWLEEFFKLETTLGIPSSKARMNIPKWATGTSSFVSIRCLENEVIKKIYKEISTPFFSTSLNLTGNPPIIKESEAMSFYKQHAPDAHFIQADLSRDLSGSSSTIIFLDENLNIEIKREGARVNEVKDHVRKLFY